MEKAEKKSEGRTDVLINEGESIAADHENQPTFDRIPDVSKSILALTYWELVLSLGFA